MHKAYRLKKKKKRRRPSSRHMFFSRRISYRVVSNKTLSDIVPDIASTHAAKSCSCDRVPLQRDNKAGVCCARESARWQVFGRSRIHRYIFRQFHNQYFLKTGTETTFFIKPHNGVAKRTDGLVVTHNTDWLSVFTLLPFIVQVVFFFFKAFFFPSQSCFTCI